MGLMIKFLCAILVIGLASMFVLKTPDGQPWLSVDDFIPDTSTITEFAKNTSILFEKNKISKNDSAENTHTTKSTSGIYRWKDDKGQWQFSDTPPINQQAETINVSGNLNKDLVEKFEPPEPELVTESTANESPTTSILPATLSPEKVSKLINDAKNVQQLMDDRQSQLDKQIR